MKILVVTKRYTSAKDISSEDVGRPYCLFAALAGVGHRVTFLLGDYRKRERIDRRRGDVDFKIRPLGLGSLISFRREIARELARGGHDVLIAEGDPVFALLASGPCREARVPLIYDLMDNYETYDIYRIPFFGRLDRAVMKRADLLVCVTDALRAKIRPLRDGGICVVGNGVNTDRFRPMDKDDCRRKLSLPRSGPIVGYFGYIVGYKGIDLLLAAQRLLQQEGFPLTLLLAGDKANSVMLSGKDLIFRGLVPQSEMPSYINACDAVAVPSPSNAYTDYCFPLKLLEGISCGVPVAATALGPVRELMGDAYPLLVAPADYRDMAAKLRAACRGSGRAGLRETALRNRWVDKAGSLGEALIGACPSNGSRRVSSAGRP